MASCYQHRALAQAEQIWRNREPPDRHNYSRVREGLAEINWLESCSGVYLDSSSSTGREIKAKLRFGFKASARFVQGSVRNTQHM